MITPVAPASIARQSHTSFYAAMAVLPRPKREAMYAVYAFCRVLDDIVDEQADPPGGSGGPHNGRPVGPDEARRQLSQWRTEIDACYAAAPTHPVARNLAPVLRRYAIPREHLHELINGMEMDLTQSRYETFEQLRAYCWRVASVVGLISLRVFGYRHARTETFAEHLGLALQWTNILRDVKSDAARGRIYLPLEELRRFGCSEEELLAGRRTPAVEALMAFACGRGRELFAQAQASFVPEESRTLYPALIMGMVYRRILSGIEAARYDVFTRRITVPTRTKIRLALYGLAAGRLGIGRASLARCLV